MSLSLSYYKLCKFLFKNKWKVLVIWLIALIFTLFITVPNIKSLDDGFSIPGTESQVALTKLTRTLPEVSGGTGNIIITSNTTNNIDQIKYEIADFSKSLEKESSIASVSNPFEKEQNYLISKDKKALLINIVFKETTFSIPQKDKDNIRQKVIAFKNHLGQNYSLHLGGTVFSFEMPRVGLTEGIGVLLALIALFILLRTFIGSILPIFTSLIALVFSISSIFLFTNIVQINSTTPILSLMLGLAIGIDYALFIINKHRINIKNGVEKEESICAALASAGSAVTFAGLTVIISLLGLSFSQIPFLTIMGQFGSFGILLAVLTSLTVLPILLNFAGLKILTKRDRDNYLSLEKNNQLVTVFENKISQKSSFWVNLSSKYPKLSIIVVVVLLGSLSIPALSLKLSIPDALSYSKENEGRKVAELTSSFFGAGYLNPVIVVGSILDSTDPKSTVKYLKKDFEKMGGVVKVVLATPNKDASLAVFNLIPKGASDSPESDALVESIRDKQDYFLDRYNFDAEVTGIVATKMDVSSRLTNALLPFSIVVIGLCFILLLIIFRSFWIPLIATFGFILSTSSSLGVISLFSNVPFLSSLMGSDRISPVISFAPIIIMSVLFGLVMDYQVFLGSSILEDFKSSKNAKIALSSGYSKTSSVVICAFAIMFSIFVMFIPTGNVNIKYIALGLAVGVFSDAIIIRMLFMPSFLSLLGEKAFQTSPKIDKLIPVVDIEGGVLNDYLKTRETLVSKSQDSVYINNYEIKKGEIQNLRDVEKFVKNEIEARSIINSIVGKELNPCFEIIVQGKIPKFERTEIFKRTLFFDFNNVSIIDVSKELKKLEKYSLVLFQNVSLLETDSKQIFYNLLDSLDLSNQAVIYYA